MEDILQKFLIFRKFIFKLLIFNFLELPYNARESSGEKNDLFWILSKSSIKLFKKCKIRRNFWNWDENSCNFSRKSNWICEKIKKSKFDEYFQRCREINPCAKFSQFGRKMKHFVKCSANFRIFGKISMKNWSFPSSFDNILLGFLLLLLINILLLLPWKITAVFYSNFFAFSELSGVPPSWSLWILLNNLTPINSVLWKVAS